MWFLRFTVVRKNQTAPLLGKMLGEGLFGRPAEFTVEQFGIAVTKEQRDEFNKRTLKECNERCSELVKTLNAKEAFGIVSIFYSGSDKLE
jgi:hypothetical protein